MKITTTVSDADYAAIVNGDAVEFTVWAPLQIDLTVVEVSTDRREPVAVRQLRAERINNREIRVIVCEERPGL